MKREKGRNSQWVRASPLEGPSQACTGRLDGSRRFTGPQATPHWPSVTRVLLDLL